MYLFITAHSMERAENPVVDTDKHNLVSSMIMIAVSGFTYVKKSQSHSVYVCPSAWSSVVS